MKKNKKNYANFGGYFRKSNITFFLAHDTISEKKRNLFSGSRSTILVLICNFFKFFNDSTGFSKN